MKVLLTGANGYLGSRLVHHLLEAGHHVIALVRNKDRFEAPPDVDGQVELIEGDLLHPKSLENIPKDIEAAYYLVHSMGASYRSFERLEDRAARNFVDAMDQTQAKQIIYVSSLTQVEEISKQAASFKRVEALLSQAKAGTTILRPGIVIGSGGSSFEIIRDLVEYLPVMIAPQWMRSQCQPIGITDLIYYLNNVLGNEATYDKTFELGGPDRLSFKEMLEIMAEERGMKRWIYLAPINAPKASAYWIYLLCSTNLAIAQAQVEALQEDSLVHDTSIQKIVPHKCMGYREALQRAFDKINDNSVVSSWKDAMVSGQISGRISDYIHVPEHGCLAIKESMTFIHDPEAIIFRVWSLGGKNGWYTMNWAWKLRGKVDKLFGGVGLQRGRTHDDHLVPGDVLDLWRVIVADREKGHLLLYGEMAVPGEAWLEFQVDRNDQGSGVLKQTASFRPKGLFGRFCWYLLFPLHKLILHRLIYELSHPTLERMPESD